MAKPWFNDVSRNSYSRVYPRGVRRRRRSFGFFDNLSLTGWLIFVNVVFFIGAFIFGFSGYVPCSESVCKYIAIQPNNFLLKGYVWTAITSMFMHGSFAHLLVNMFVLFSLGSLCERIIGRVRFFWFYILSGIFAGLLFVALAFLSGGNGVSEAIFGSPLTYAVGASGAIFAIAGLFVMLTPKLKFMIIFLPFFSLPAYIMVPLILFLTWIVSSVTGLPVGNVAHFGGFLVGIVYGAYLRKKYSRKVRMIGDLFS